MLRLILLSVLACVAFGDEDTNDCKCKWKQPGVFGGVSIYGLVSTKVDVQSVRIFQLERRLQQVTEKLAQLRNRSTSALATELEQRLDDLEGTGCSKTQFACGGDSHECISSLLACDGSADCANGADEDSKLCSVHVPVGSTWEGNAQWSACDDRDDSHYRITIISEHRSKYFPSRDRIKAILNLDVVKNGKTETSVEILTGQWSPALKKLALSPPEDHPLKVLLVCRPRYDFQAADCKIVRQATHEECAKLTLNLVRH